MGLKRFQEWIREEGLPGSQELLRCYNDIQGQLRLLDEVTVSRPGEDKLIVGGEQKSEDLIHTSESERRSQVSYRLVQLS